MVGHKLSVSLISGILEVMTTIKLPQRVASLIVVNDEVIPGNG